MAVAVKNTTETASSRLFNRLAVDSFAGVFYVLGSIGLVFYGIPALWNAVTPVSVALEILVMAVVALGLIVLGLRLPGPHPPQGLRAGIFVGIIEVVAIIIVTCAAGAAIQRWNDTSLGAALTVGIGIALCAAAALTFVRPQFERGLITLEDQGWFFASSYKRSQGQRVRRGTIFGLLVLAGCGIYTMLHHNSLASGSRHWLAPIPFTDGYSLVLLPDVRITLPIILTLGSLWLAYRVVNLPVFADFLIATEAELNKVSWTTRKRLIQDTMVVLVTVVLLTVFLFVVDQTWAFLLSKVGVLQISPTNTQQVGPKEQPF